METGEYRSIIDQFYQRMNELEEEKCSVKMAEDKWSLKEMVGHLIDSACNNHQRFTRLQLEMELEFPAYDPEAWVRVEKINAMPWKELTVLWYSYNNFLLNIMEGIDHKNLKNTWKKGNDKLTLEFIVQDYFRHMKWHRDFFEERLKEIAGC